MGKTAKSAKKFVKKHLKSTIDRRRKLKPMKQAMKRKQAKSSFAAQNGKLNPETDELVQKSANKKSNGTVKNDFVDGEVAKGLDYESDSSLQSQEESDSDQNLDLKDGEEDFIDITPADLEDEASEDEEDEDGSGLKSQNKSLTSEVEKHKKQLEKLKEKDPEFFQFLKEHDQELLEFEDDEEEDMEDLGKGQPSSENVVKDMEASTSLLSTGLVEAWCKIIKEKNHLGTIYNLLRAYRTACHYGDGEENEFANQYTISSSHVFNKVMFFTLSEIDNVFRKLLGVDVKEGSSFEPEKCPRWKKVEPLVKSYLGNSLHILSQMTDNRMIAFTLKRLKASTCFLTALPRFARKYLKVVLHFWGRGEGSVSLISFLFIREMALLMGTSHLDSCLKGIYKEFAANSKFVNPSSLPRIRFMINCVVELYGIDLTASYQQAFVFIRQLAIILRNALTMKTKESYKNVYSWQFVNCLELWVYLLCQHSGNKDLQPLVYPLTQIITGVAQLVPTARYFPLRMRCVKMLNRLAAETGTFIPVSALLLDMLEFKELSKPPTGGVGKSVDFDCTLKVSKPTLKTRGFQDECIASSIEQLSEHLRQWSYSVAFPELALVPLTGVRRFMKTTNVDRFRRQIKQLVDHIEENVQYVGRKRDGVNFSPKDTQLVASFLKEDKLANLSPLSKFASSLRQSAEQRRANLHSTSVLVKEDAPVEKEDSSEDEDTEVFSSDWLPPKKPKSSEKQEKSKQKTKSALSQDVEDGSDAEDIVEDLDLSSSEDEMDSGDDLDDEMESDENMDSDGDNDQEHKKSKSKEVKKPGKWKGKTSFKKKGHQKQNGKNNESGKKSQSFQKQNGKANEMGKKSQGFQKRKGFKR